MEGFAGSVFDIGRRALVRFVELEGFDRAMALAGQAFAALLPLLIVVGAVTPGGGKDLADGLIDRFDLHGQAASTLQAAVAQPAAVQDGVSALSAFLLVISALSFTRALQRLYLRAWRLPPMRLVRQRWGLAWLAAFSVFWTLQTARHQRVRRARGADRRHRAVDRALALHALDPRRRSGSPGGGCCRRRR